MQWLWNKKKQLKVYAHNFLLLLDGFFSFVVLLYGLYYWDDFAAASKYEKNL